MQRGQEKIIAKKNAGKSGIDAFIVEDSDESGDSFEEANEEARTLMGNNEDADPTGTVYSIQWMLEKKIVVYSLTRNVAVLDDVVEDRRVAVVLRRPSDLQRATADARQVDGGRRGWHIFWNET